MRPYIMKWSLLVGGLLLVVNAAGWSPAARAAGWEEAQLGVEARPVEPQEQAGEEVGFKLVVRSSPLAVSESFEQWKETRLSKAWAKKSLLDPQLGEDQAAEQLLPLSDTELQVQSAQGTERVGLGAPSLLVDLDTGKQWVLARSAWNVLRDKAIEVRLRHYGELLTWQEAQNKVPRKSIFQITDLETGLFFRVQRRAGSQHADVQPMTKADTAIMKQIYGGKWSWKRRAIIVNTADNNRIAASMHGMPHGGDGIPGNGFSGHFCIHFRGSTTHKSDSMDMAHQLMVYKAAGKLVPYLENAGPDDLVFSYLEGLIQHDAAIVSIAGQGLGLASRALISKQLETITSIRLDKQEPVLRGAGSLQEQIVRTALVSRKGRKPSKEKIAFTVSRTSVESPWRITDVRMDG
jgi:hypothetical protein